MGDTAEKHLVYCRIVRDGAVLYLRRAPGVFRAGQWELPGGTVEPGEPHEIAAVREVAEETGLAVHVTGERGRHTWMDIGGKDLRIHARVFDVDEGAPRDVVLHDGEHDEFTWLTDPAGLDLADHFRA
ncbi:NUDIX hydrolase [Actinophytocola sp. NPDC049390]|uniref:NUDIX hydrolase n=1 Tax=Actinophytocola sp. NPDC049390 TaxID=3363894 RepID=UPI0037923D3F